MRRVLCNVFIDIEVNQLWLVLLISRRFFYDDWFAITWQLIIKADMANSDQQMKGSFH